MLMTSYLMRQLLEHTLLRHFRNHMTGYIMNDYLKSVRKQLMLRALAIANGNQSQAAKLLYRRVKWY